VKNRVPIQPILLVIFLATIAVFILAKSQINLFQSGDLKDSGDILIILQEKFPDSTIHSDIMDPNIIVLVHNGESEQCRRAIRFVENITSNNDQYVASVYVLNEQNYLKPLSELPEGTCWLNNQLPEEWLVYPTIFFEDLVYVGYGPATRWDIKKKIGSDLVK
jgi:hypothetical protein